MLSAPLRRSRLIWLSGALWNRRIVFMAGAVAVGLAAVAFALGADYANARVRELAVRYPWAPFLSAPLGFMALRWMTGRWFQAAQGSGIPQTIAALDMGEPAERDRLLSLRVALGKVALTLGGLFCGASIGREGPTVQVGASLMHALGRSRLFPSEGMQRGLILAGGAAGVAAAFNAPLAGIVFAIEEMSRSFEQRTSVIVLVGVITAGLVSVMALGNYAYFGQSAASLDIRRGWLAIALCGAAGGLCGGLFSRCLIFLGSAPPGQAFNRLRSLHPVLFAGVCGLIVAALGLASNGSIFGTGYRETRAILAGGGATPVLFGPLKLAATVASYASGIPGGIFSPSLAVGAGFGYDIAQLLPSVPVQAVIILGMVGYFSGVVQAPITAFVIVAEMTRDSDMALPLMACSLVAYGLSRTVCPTPIYKALAQQFMQSRQLLRN